jgi:DNA-binding NtrC family response regulator
MKTRILIIEDEKSAYDLLAHALGDDDAYDLVWTQTAHEAIRRAHDEQFDLVLLDFDVTDANPLKALDQFHALHPFLPVIVLTERARQAELAAMRGADAFLQKPLDEPNLIRTMNQLLAESRQGRMSRLIGSLRSWLHAPEAPGAHGFYEENNLARR